MGYLAVSSFIYVEHFSLSAKVYSYFFAANAFFSLLGPVIYIKFLSGINKSKLTYAVFAMMAVSGICVMTVGNMSPFLFWLTFMIFGMLMSLTRPYSVNIILEQQKSDTGSASSIMNTLFTVLGSLGMFLASLPWKNSVVSLGVMIFATALISIVSWGLFMKSKIGCTGLKD
jgi:DHA1 family bicyclomycin/chloramphenicol resistance-like MFS transporter